MFDCVASIGGIARGAVAAVAAQHDHFDQVHIACTAGHIHGKSLQLLCVYCICIAWGEVKSHCCEIQAAGGSVLACVSLCSRTSWAWVGIQHHLHM